MNAIANCEHRSRADPLGTDAEPGTRTAPPGQGRWPAPPLPAWCDEGLCDGPSRSTRRALLLGGARRFAESGYHGTSVSEVLAAAADADHRSLTKGALYFHFPSKQELALGLVHESGMSWGAVAAAAEGAGVDGDRAHRDPLTTTLRISDAAAAMAMYDPITRAAWRIRGDHESFAAALAVAELAELARLTALLERARDAGILAARVEPSWAAEHAVTLFAGHCLRSDDPSSRRGDLWTRLTDAWEALLPAVASDEWLEEWRDSRWSQRPRPAREAHVAARESCPGAAAAPAGL